jgi:hypothetical protein
MMTKNKDKDCPGCEANRITLLNQAERILVNRFTVHHEKVRYLVDRGLVDAMTIEWPEPPSSENIIEEAKKLQTFVKEKYK